MSHGEEAPGCLLCGSRERRILFRLAHPIVRCQQCGLVYADAPAGPIGERYTESYYRGEVYSDYLADRPVIHRNAARALREIEGRTQGRRLLDVGCAAGFFLEAAHSRGWSVAGVEVSEFAAGYARNVLGLDVWNGPVEDIPVSMPHPDAVTLWDVIEHLERPDRALRRLHSLLKPGGVLALSTGDHGSLLRRLSGSRWRLFADPTHRFFFDQRTLGRLLAAAGFRILDSCHRGKWVGLPMVVKQAPLPLGRRLRAGLERALRDRFVYVNLFDVVTVIAAAEAAPRSS